MTLRDKTALGMSLPHRSPDPLALTTIGTVARRAEELGFRDLWVTENTVDDGTCLDPVVALTFAASITKRIGVGAAVIVLPIHHPLTGGASVGDARFRQRRTGDPGRRAWPRPPLPGFPGSRGAARAPLPRGGGADQGTVDRGQGHLPRADLPGGERQAGHTASAQAAPAFVDGSGPSGCGAPGGGARRRLDGLRRIEHCRVQGLGADPEAGLGGGRPRSHDVSGIQARVHGRRRAARRGASRNSSAGSPRSTTIRPAPTPRASTARPSRCASGSRNWWRPAPITCS